LSEATIERDAEKNRIQKYHQRFSSAKLAVEPKHNIWAKLDMFDRGEQWKDVPLPPWVPKPVANWIRYVRTLKRANLASAIPSAHYTARSEQHQPVMKKMQRAYEHVWQTEKVQKVIRRSIDRSIIQGTAIAIVYNDDAYVGGTYLGENDPGNRLYNGKICVKRFPNANFFPDPDASCLADMKYCDTTEQTTLSAIKNNPKFKEFAGENLAKLTYSMLSQDENESGEIYGRDNKVTNNSQNVIGDEMVTMHTHWERFINESGQWQLDIVYYLANSDFELYRVEDYKPGVYPFAVLYDEEEEDDFWGTSTAMDIWENQKIINKVAQTASIIGVLHQNPQKIVSRNSGINAQELARTGTMPGKVWTTNDDPKNSIHSIEPADIPKGLFDLEDRLKNDIRESVGINEAYTGQSVGSLTTSTGVNSLIERATIRDKDKMLQIDDFVEQISDLIMLNILYKWKEKREITTVGPNGQPQYDIFEPVDENTIKNLDWIVRSDVYAKAPTTQALRREQADKLIQMQGQFNYSPPIITVEEWIRFQDFDMKEEILQRMQADRKRLESEKAMNLAEKWVQLADILRQNIARGMPMQQAQQEAQKAAEEMIAAQKQQEMAAGRPKDVEQEAQAPQGTTGQLAMAAMSRGA
jgi:hypothetical protein